MLLISESGTSPMGMPEPSEGQGGELFIYFDADVTYLCDVHIGKHGDVKLASSRVRERFLADCPCMVQQLVLRFP